MLKYTTTTRARARDYGRGSSTARETSAGRPVGRPRRVTDTRASVPVRRRLRRAVRHDPGAVAALARHLEIVDPVDALAVAERTRHPERRAGVRCPRRGVDVAAAHSDDL